MTHTIGDCLYELVDGNWDGNGGDDYVLTWPVVKVTERFIHFRGARMWQSERTFRLDRADLERNGYTYHRGERVLLYTRPQLDWPMVVLDVSDGRRALAAAGLAGPFADAS